MRLKQRKAQLQKYISILVIGYKNYTAYIYDILGINIVFIFRIVVIVFFYKAIYAVTGGSATMGSGMEEGLINGYSVAELIWALIFVQSVVTSRPRVTNEIDADIKTGKIGVFLLNPVSYIWFKFFEYMPKFLYNLGITLAIGLVIGYLFVGSIDTSFMGVVGGLLLLLGGTMVSFFGYMMGGLLGFFTEDTGSWRLIYSKLDLVFGGNILPIGFMPAIMQTIAFALPFAYGGYTAGLLFVNYDGVTFLKYFGMQLVRIFLLIGVCFLIYTIGKKKITINGG